jgi:CheY-like chemotaxis protein
MDLAASASHVQGDPARLQQVLWNLIKNAVKFTPEEGSVSIRTRNEGDPPRLVVTVADTGIGIDPETLPRIFNAFEQGESSTTRRFGGLGLGLAISRSVVEAHGGTIEVQSPGKDQGATFEVALKTVAPPAPRGSSGPAQTDEMRPSLKILFVEDDPPTRRIMAQLLQLRQYRVTAVSNLKAALEVGRSEEFDILVSDIGLPDGTGWELIRALSAERPIRAIALTGFGMDDDVRRCQEAGFVAHLTKPVDFARLDELIRSVADGGPAGTMTPEPGFL